MPATIAEPQVPAADNSDEEFWERETILFVTPNPDIFQESESNESINTDPLFSPLIATYIRGPSIEPSTESSEET